MEAATGALQDIIRDRVRQAGSISFREFMELALYHPRHGYYRTHDPELDYQTSPQVHPVFGAAIGRALAAMWRALGRPPRFDVFEDGAGAGELAAGVLAWARDADASFFGALRYTARDPSGRLRDLPAALAGAGLPVDAARAVEEPPEAAEGCVLANELLDSLPVHRVVLRQGELRELRVALEGERFVDAEAPAPPEVLDYFRQAGVFPAEGCEAEVNLEAPRWLGRAASWLGRGYLLTLDYGYLASELYSAARRRGTLLTFRRHAPGDDAYADPGGRDMTASVDFSALFRAGATAGLQPVLFTSQADFLAQLGIRSEAARRPHPGEDLSAFYALRRSVQELTSPSGLGRIRVLLMAKEAPPPTLDPPWRTEA
jgi:SAM-dependent MidA family methyltransferase